MAIFRNDEVMTRVGPVGLKVPKVRSRGDQAVLRSSLVPPYVRRAKTLDAALPWLYLKGISTGQMGEALEVLVGPEPKGLSASVVSRLKKTWYESTFSTIRHRTDQSKGCVMRNTMLAMIHKLGLCAEKRWRRIRGFDHLAKVIEGVPFKDGIEVNTTDSRSAA